MIKSWKFVQKSSLKNIHPYLEGGAVTCQEDRDCFDKGDMCCFDLSNLTLASVSQVCLCIMKAS